MPALRATRRAFICSVFLLAGIFSLRAAGTAPEGGNGNNLILTPEEQAWLASHPHIRLGYDPSWPPFSYRDTNGEIQGIDADVLALIAQRLGVHFELVTANTWSEVYAKALAREVDVLGGTASTPERQPFFRFSSTYLSFPVAIITRTDAPFLWSAQDLTGHKVAAPRDYAPTLDLQREYPGLQLQLTDTVEQAMKLLSSGQAEAVVTNLANASFIIKTRGLTNLKIAGMMPRTFDLRFAVRPDWPELVGILDKGIASLTPADLQAVNNHWIRIDYAGVVRWDVVWKFIAGVAVCGAIAIVLIVLRSRRLAYELAQRLRLQQALEDSHDRLARLNEEKAELLRMAAHDLRNPLTAILLSFDLAQQGGLKPEVALERIRIHVEQMMQLMSDLLDSQMLEAGGRKFALGAVSTSAIAHDVLDALAPSAERKKIRFDTSGIEGTPPALADPHALRQIVENLVSNAMKFSPPGSIIWLRLREWNGRVRFEVRDQGPGVRADEQERIFAKYVRGSAKPTGGESSTGIGLSIVRQLATAMNGRAWCESESGQGATFVVVLPAAALFHPLPAPVIESRQSA
ncbi:MAG TPA: transporter substrate-binding domain-containing protein [Opitutaceae bacterium]|nr:transporter substrate-binding domain-containing protein [Opitutaceae bacterium]